MIHDQAPPGHSLPPSGGMRADDLCPEQKDFARVLGRLLARLWDRESRGREEPPARHGGDSTPAP